MAAKYSAFHANYFYLQGRILSRTSASLHIARRRHKLWRKLININSLHGFNAKILNHSLYLNEIRTNPPGADLERVAIPKGCVPGTARIQNLAANLERSPLTHSLSYGPAGDRPTLFVRHVPAPHPFRAYAKNRSRRF